MAGTEERKYERVASYIRTYVDQKKFTHHARIPSEHFLCAKFSVSRDTVRTAIRMLVEEGLLYTVKGSGTFFNTAAALSKSPPPAGEKLRIGFIAQGQDLNASANVVNGIRSALDKGGAELKIFLTDNKIANERKCLEACSVGFHGLIIDGVKASILNPNVNYYSRLYEKGLRMIFFNNYYLGTPFPKVILDDAACADELIRRLVEKGHTHIAGIFVYDNYQGIEKYKGCVQAILKYGAKFDDKYVKWCISDETYDKAYPRTIMKFIKGLPKATAIVCCNYMILQMVQQLFKENSLSIPRDYSVVCFDYSSTDWAESGITASIHPGFDMGYEVGARILDLVRDPDYLTKDYSYVFKPHIFDGGSIGKVELAQKNTF